MTLLHVVATRQAAERQYARSAADVALAGGRVDVRRRQLVNPETGQAEEWMAVNELHLLAGREITDWDMDDGVVLTPNQLRLLRVCKARAVG